ncbi:MAG: ECF transporter S component [Faecousia sp.]
MKLKQLIPGIVAIAGLIGALLLRSPALAENASGTMKLCYSISLIVVVVGVALTAAGFVPQRQKISTRNLAMAAMFAALCYIGFAYLRIDIPVGSEKTAFHLGNVFCVLAALFLGGMWGGLSGAVGLTLADLTSGYVTSAPKTFLLKLCIGLIAGAVAHGVFHISREKLSHKHLVGATAASCAAGMAFNVVADPVVGYFYKVYVLGVPQDAANIWAKIGAVTTLVNAVIAVAAASVLYLALRPALEKSKLMPHIE